MPISFLNAALLASHSKRSRVGLPAASTGGTCNRSLAGASRTSNSSSRSFLLRGRWELTAVASVYGHALAGGVDVDSPMNQPFPLRFVPKRMRESRGAVVLFRITNIADVPAGRQGQDRQTGRSSGRTTR